jgi:hypothetical protein
LLIRRVDDAEPDVFDASSPYGYPGVLLSESGAKSEGFADRCVAELRSVLAQRNICSAFLRMNPLLNNRLAECLTDDALEQSGVTVSIDIAQTPEKMWSSTRKGHTNAINKARRFGYEVVIRPAAASFEQFFSVYSQTITRLGADSQYHFSERYLRRLTSLPQSFVALALLGTEVAGAYLLFECEGIVQMHLGGPRAEFMRPSSSNLMIHEVAVWGHRRGDDVLHLGGGVGGSGGDSLFTFKSGFSPLRNRFDTLRVIADRDTYSRLVTRAADARGVTVDALLSSGFFPAYRSPVTAT